MAQTAELDKAIDAATEEILEIDKKSKTPSKDKKEVESTSTEEEEGETAESSEESQDSEDESSEDDLDEDTLAEAKNLYRAIKGPQGPAIIAALAQQAGLLKAETPAEVKRDVKSLSQIVTEALGPEFKMLAPQMTKLMQDVLESERQERTAKFNEIEQQNTSRETHSVMEKIAKENKISSDQLGKLILPLTDEFLPGPKTSVETYIRGLYKQATVGRIAAKTNAQIADKARRNASDAPSRLHSAGSVSESKLPPKKMNLKESIKWAQEQIAAGDKG